MSAAVTRPEFRSPERIRADEEIAERFEAAIVKDAVTGWAVHAASDERRRQAAALATDPNNAIAPGRWDVPFLWQGKVYRIVRASYKNGRAEVETSPADPALASVLASRIESTRHHVLTYYQGFGFICLPEESTRYQDS